MPLVFAGYGISAPALKYDEYAGLDVAAKAVMIFTHEPQEQSAESPFDDTTPTVHGTVMQKAMLARSRGARLVLMVEDPSHPTDGASYRGFLHDPQADAYGIAVVRVDRARLTEALGGAIEIEAIGRGIDRDLAPRSRPLEGVSVQLTERFVKTRRQVRNVIGVLHGSDPARASEALVIGAHYDHLGRGGRHSLAANAVGQIHNGADDNASGTAAVIEIAQAASAGRAAYPRTLVFVAFAGEELGLLGLAYYTAPCSVHRAP